MTFYSENSQMIENVKRRTGRKSLWKKSVLIWWVILIFNNVSSLWSIFSVSGIWVIIIQVRRPGLRLLKSSKFLCGCSPRGLICPELDGSTSRIKWPCTLSLIVFNKRNNKAHGGESSRQFRTKVEVRSCFSCIMHLALPISTRNKEATTVCKSTQNAVK